ncbi:hypothetical protein [Mycolicibacterium gadium]|jgi:hypothetical protein|uniref:hypothetical protein n=1 Tax=Mycolicibacterium gadium TaxID=1794 RepID=UPI002FDDF78B
MDVSHIYPERRDFIDSYEADEVADRLEELLSFGEPFAITADSGPWVMVPAARYDDLVASMIALTNMIEARRQAVDPLPPL